MKRNILITGKKGFIGRQIIGGKEFKGRLENYKSLLNQTKDIIGIVHLAAVSNNRLCQMNPKKCINSNLISLCNILEVALKRNIWVLFISSFQIKEMTLYGLSKLFGEELCRIYQQKGLKVRIIRLPIIYGPDDRQDKIVTKIIRELQFGINPKITTNKKFHFIYVNDAAKTIENEVSIIEGKLGKKYSLHQLKDGIKECLREKKK